jgi:hypothetical protein
MKSLGLGDVMVTLANTTAMGGDMNLHYGAHVSMSPVKAKDATTTADGTEATGGWAVDPYVGLAQEMGGGLSVGGQLEYAYRGERTVSDNGTPEVDAKVTGGHTATLTGLLEKEMGQLALTGNIFYATTAAADSENSGVTTTTEAFSTTGAGVGLYYYPTSQLTLRGSYGLGMVSEHGTGSTTKVGAYNVSTVGLGARYEF